MLQIPQDDEPSGSVILNEGYDFVPHPPGLAGQGKPRLPQLLLLPNVEVGNHQAISRHQSWFIVNWLNLTRGHGAYLC